jgi:hypothetical protein
VWFAEQCRGRLHTHQHCRLDFATRAHAVPPAQLRSAQRCRGHHRSMCCLRVSIIWTGIGKPLPYVCPSRHQAPFCDTQRTTLQQLCAAEPSPSPVPIFVLACRRVVRVAAGAVSGRGTFGSRALWAFLFVLFCLTLTRRELDTRAARSSRLRSLSRAARLFASHCGGAHVSGASFR